MSGAFAKTYVTWTDVERMVGKLLNALPGDYDNILVITRGGMVPACLISERTGIRNILCAAVILYEDEERSLPEPAFVQFPEDRHVRGRRILVVDDVWDSGTTVMAVRDRLRRAGATADVCVLHFKPGRNLFPGDGPDYHAAETNGWIVYPWDPELPLPPP
jgi:hypoxanthine phosphoribosyltransferase